jgi:hypothetical protein
MQSRVSITKTLGAACAAAACVALLASLSGGRGAERHSARSVPPAVAGRLSRVQRSRIANLARRLPLAFEQNHGQAAAGVRYVANGPGFGLALTRTGVSVALARQSGTRGAAAAVRVLGLSLHGAHPAALSASRALPGISNYLIGNDRSRWVTGVRRFARVTYRSAWPGIDAVVSGNAHALRYDFVVAPAANADRIAVGVHGADGARIDRNGRLVLSLAGKAIVQPAPVAYQRAGNHTTRVAARYALAGRTLRIHLGNYDHARPLVIDPSLYYSTYLGGAANDAGLAIAVDSTGAAYVTGLSTSTNFPTTGGAFQTGNASGGFYDAVVTKLSADGSSLVYSTYLGGGGNDIAQGIAVDSAGAAYVTGWTDSGNLPTTVGAFQTAYAGADDAFVAKLSADGSSLAYSTYLGGAASADYGYGIAVASTGAAFVAGVTCSSNFPTTGGAFQTTLDGTCDAFVTKVGASGASLGYSTFLGGSGFDYGNAIAIDSNGAAYVAGETGSGDFPISVHDGAFQTTIAGGNDAFVTELNGTGSALTYSTYLGGGSDDVAEGVAVDSNGAAYVTGYTESSNFPTSGAFQNANAGGTADVFVTKVSAGGSALGYSTYLGGTGDDEAVAIAVDSTGAAWVTGYTDSTDYPTTAGALQSAIAGTQDALVSKLGVDGSTLGYSTYLGGSVPSGLGSASGAGTGIAIDSTGAAYVTGETRSTDFPVVGAFQGSNAGHEDAFVVKFGPKATPAISTQASADVLVGSAVHDTATIANASSPTGSITFKLYGPNDLSCSGAAAFTSSAIAVSGNGDYGSGNFTPTQAGTYRWTAAYSGDSGNQAVAAACNAANESVVVSLSADGSGSLTATPASVSASSHQTITLVYTAATGGLAGGAIRITVPSGWSAPSVTATDAGYATATTGALAVSGQMITVSALTRSAGQKVTVTYGSRASGGPGATAAAALGSQSWAGQEQSTSDGTLTPLGSSPAVVVYAHDGSGTMTVSPAKARAGTSGNTLTFTYKAAAGGIANGNLTIVVPAGWSAPSVTATAPGYVTANHGTVTVPGGTILVSGLTLAGGATVTVVYGAKTTGPGATAPANGIVQMWTTRERSTISGSATAISGSPSVDVLAKDGSGSMARSVASVIHSSTGHTITFTYTVAAGGMSGGTVSLAVPSGWSVPSVTATAAGYVTASAGTRTVSGSTITVSGLTLAAGAHLTIVYGSKTGTGHGATAPAATGSQTWTTKERSSTAGTVKLLGTSPAITVT